MGKEVTNIILETRKICVVPIVDLAFVIDHCEEIVLVNNFWSRISSDRSQSVQAMTRS